MEIHRSARKHAIADEDIEDAITNAMAKKTHAKTASGKQITDELVAELAEKAAAGYDVDETLRRRPGRPSLGSAPASVESVRLEPELREALTERAERDRETTSAVIRKALRKYLDVS